MFLCILFNDVFNCSEYAEWNDRVICNKLQVMYIQWVWHDPVGSTFLVLAWRDCQEPRQPQSA